MTQQAFSMWFDEGPRIVNVIRPGDALGRYVNTGGIDTSAVDQHRQGVEITLAKHMALGLVKLTTGEVGGMLKQDFFGMGGQPGLNAFVDADSLGSAGSSVSSNDGVLEPFALRTLVAGQEDVRLARGALMGGTEDADGRAAQVVTQWEIKALAPAPPYNDGSDVLGSTPVQSVLDPGSTALIMPASDETTKSGVRVPAGADSTLAAALHAMSPASDTHINEGWTSAATGFMYGPSVRVDSIVFGGQDR